MAKYSDGQEVIGINLMVYISDDEMERLIALCREKGSNSTSLMAGQLLSLALSDEGYPSTREWIRTGTFSRKETKRKKEGDPPASTQFKTKDVTEDTVIGEKYLNEKNMHEDQNAVMMMVRDIGYASQSKLREEGMPRANASLACRGLVRMGYLHNPLYGNYKPTDKGREWIESMNKRVKGFVNGNEITDS